MYDSRIYPSFWRFNQERARIEDDVKPLIAQLESDAPPDVETVLHMWKQLRERRRSRAWKSDWLEYLDFNFFTKQ